MILWLAYWEILLLWCMTIGFNKFILFNFFFFSIQQNYVDVIRAHLRIELYHINRSSKMDKRLLQKKVRKPKIYIDNLSQEKRFYRKFFAREEFLQKTIRKILLFVANFEKF